MVLAFLVLLIHAHNIDVFILIGAVLEEKDMQRPTLDAQQNSS